ncbi:glycoside hydrolase family 15 protein [Phenylobacterium sp.]|uniref:glycoside hydrolase family 15 protein n=1 Tax=Phenylobacterium sp. TaxID=1871053 RepID=UPI00300330EB
MQRIEDYGLIGDGESAALVSRNGSIDWLAWPRFDSEACFAALLGEEQHGFWRIAADGARPISRRYCEGSLVLEHDFECLDGASYRVIDFMEPRQDDPRLIRQVVGLKGRSRLSLLLRPRFDYGAVKPWLQRTPSGEVRAVAGPHSVILRPPCPVDIGEGDVRAAFEVDEGETINFVLHYEPSHIYTPEPCDPEAALQRTLAYWRGWVAKSRYQGAWGEAVNRSLITIKALIYAPTGGIIAAPTTSLPEQIGGARNWDYRFCWLRDASFSMLSLMNAGYRKEAEAWCEWVLRAMAGEPDEIQPVYGLAGERRLEEREVGWLPGYEGSTPVRIGNGAARQFQIDAFGWIMDTMHQARAFDLELREDDWALQTALLAHLEQVWRRPDEGIWEVRGGPRHFVHSKVMAWVAFDRAVRAVEDLGQQGPVDRWRTLRDEIHREVCAKGYNETAGAFVQSYGDEALDASVLLIPLVGFLPADDPRMVSTVAAIQARLTRDGLVLRYDPQRTDDGLESDEGVFLACSFWLADNLLLQGRREEAEALFDRLLGLRNDLGLLAEEYEPKAGRQLGNFPQAFSHFAIIDTAFNLARRKGAARPNQPRDQASSPDEPADQKA